MAEIHSRPYFDFDSEVCCEACVFGTGQHAACCEVRRTAQSQLDTLACNREAFAREHGNVDRVTYPPRGCRCERPHFSDDAHRH